MGLNWQLYSCIQHTHPSSRWYKFLSFYREGGSRSVNFIFYVLGSYGVKMFEKRCYNDIESQIPGVQYLDDDRKAHEDHRKF